MDDLRSRYERIRSQIVGPVCLIAVSKTRSVEEIEALYRLGHRDFGENYVQELVSKALVLESKGIKDIRWHMIGPLQKNKVKTLLPLIHAIHTLSDESLAEEIQKRKLSLGIEKKVRVFVQVNIDQENSKSGLMPEEVVDFCKRLHSKSDFFVEGLMCIPDPDRKDLAEPFRKMKQLSLVCADSTMGKLSMGMSDDFTVAIEHGATHVRVGTALFGPRSS